MKAVKIFLQLIFLAGSGFSQNQDWVYRNPFPQNDFYAIKFFDQNTGYVCGSNGTILKNTTGSNNWVTIPSSTNNNLYGMYFFDVNHGYVVGAGGLIMYTSDGGNNWTSVVTNNGFALRSITFVNSNTGFVAGDNGELYKTTSGITGFVPINVTSSNLHSVFFIDQNTGFVCGDNGQFLKTTNAGSNWTVQTIGNYSMTCVYFTNDQTGYLTSTGAANSSALAYRTSNGGSTWDTIPFFRIADNWGEVIFANQNTGYIIGKSNLIMHTSNAGLNWYETGVPANTFLNAICVADTFAFVCGTNGWVAKTSPSVYYQCLGGTRTNLISIAVSDENNACTIGEHMFLRTANGGINWYLNMSGGYSWEEGHSTYPKIIKAFSPTSTYLIMHNYVAAGYPSEFILKSSDAGSTWYGYYFGLYYLFGDIDESNGVAFTTAYLGTSQFVLRNLGTRWDTIYIGSQLRGPLSFANQNTGVVISGNSSPGMLRTTNQGVNWGFVSTGSPRSIACVKLLSSGIGFIGCDSAYFLKTSDFGATWVPTGYLGNNYISNMQFVNENTGWYLGTAFNNYGTPSLYYTPNGGQNFQQIQSLQNFNVKGFSFLNALTGYVCGDSGVVLKTTNGGLTFVDPTSSNIPDRFILSQNYPNPFNPVTKIKFDIPSIGTGPACP